MFAVLIILYCADFKKYKPAFFSGLCLKIYKKPLRKEGLCSLLSFYA